MPKGAQPKTKAPARSKRATTTASMMPGASHDDIARRAFELYMSRDPSAGDDLGDWFRAERELGMTLSMRDC